MRATATLLVTVAMALAAIGLAVASPGGGALASAEIRASGAVHVANSRAGQAVLTASGMRPGGSASGTVTIGNDGDARGRFAVAATSLQDTPGVYGGLLSERVVLAVIDVTDPQAPDPVFEGEPGDLEEVELGTLEPGDERDYLVRVTLPDGGAPASAITGDNRLQGATLSLGLAWRAATSAVSTPTPTPTAEPKGPAPTPTPTAVPPVTPPTAPAPVALPDALGLPAAASCVKSGKLTLRLKGPNGSKVLTATVTVNGRVKAKLKGSKARKPVSLRGLGKKSAKLKVSVKATDGRTYTASRTYRACKR